MVAAGAVAALVALPKTIGTNADTNPLTGTAQIVTTQRTVRLTAADRHAIYTTLDRFVASAVLRRDPGAAYDVATPTLRGDASRDDWAKGELPVFPFPAREGNLHAITITWSYPGDVGADLHLLARKQTGAIGAITYGLELKRMHGRWLVDSFVPTATFAPARAGQRARVRAQPDFGPGMGSGGAESTKSRLSHKWFLLPAGLFSLILLVPLGVFAVNWRRARAAERDYLAGRAS